MTGVRRAGLALGAAAVLAAAAATMAATHAADTDRTLRKGTRRELDEFGAPPTSWRVDSGVDALVAPA